MVLDTLATIIHYSYTGQVNNAILYLATSMFKFYTFTSLQLSHKRILNG